MFRVIIPSIYITNPQTLISFFFSFVLKLPCVSFVLFPLSFGNNKSMVATQNFNRYNLLPTKGIIKIAKNEKGDSLATRTITGWKM